MAGAAGSGRGPDPGLADASPRATLLGVRGRSTEEGITRWFRRFDAVTYNQDDIRAEAAAFDGFMEGAVKAYGLDPTRMTHPGYSNGANLLGAILRLQPGVVGRAILMRGIEVLADPPAADLTATRALLLTGSHDPYGRMAPALEASLNAAGADLDARVIEAGHELSPEDLEIAKSWMAG